MGSFSQPWFLQKCPTGSRRDGSVVRNIDCSDRVEFGTGDDSVHPQKFQVGATEVGDKGSPELARKTSPICELWV